MAGKGVKVDIQRLQIGRAVHHPLRAIDHHPGTHIVRQLNRPGEIGTTASDVRHLADRQQAGAVVQQGGQQADIGQPVRP